MQWIRGILHYRFQDVLRKYRARYESVSIDDPNLMAEAQIAEMSETDSESRSGELLKFLKTDPEGHLAGVHIKNKSEATLQKILLMRFPGKTFQDIAEVFAIDKHSTIASFHDRQLRKLKDYFRKYLC
jgi:DNA-directed RNA polymerase specialized sigma24 family protein